MKHLKRMVLLGFVSALLPAILVAPGAFAATVNPSEAMATEFFTDASGTSLPYRIYIPKTYSESASYSLLIFLHGAGERGTDGRACVNGNSYIINRVINEEYRENCIVVAPQCAPDYQWVDTPWDKGSYSVEKVEKSVYMTALEELIDNLQQNYSIDENRLYVSGLSMGGYGTWDLIQRNPGKFAAAIPVCGAGDPSLARRIKHMPIWTFHGDVDPTVPVSGSRDMAEALEKAGSTQFKYTEYPGVDHGSWNQAYREEELLDWLFAQERDPDVEPDLSEIAFDDVKESDWFYQSIVYVTKNELIDSKTELLFAPEEPITRADFVTAIGRLSGLNVFNFRAASFTDIDQKADYAPYVAFASVYKITNGYEDNTFRPEQSISRQEMAVMMVRYMEKFKISLPNTLDEPIPYADDAEIAEWAKDAVNLMQTTGLMTGKNDNLFDPAGTITRAEVSAILERLAEKSAL